MPVSRGPRGLGEVGFQRLTLFHAVFLGSLVIWIFVHGGDSLDTFIVVVFVWGALGGFGAFCKLSQSVSVESLTQTGSQGCHLHSSFMALP